MEIEFTVPYPRPTKLSDPNYDFRGCEYLLDELLNTPDQSMGWQEYRELFGPYLPAGTYEEVVYFLPHAFIHLKFNPVDAEDFCNAVFGFCSKNKDQLTTDKLIDTVRTQIMLCLIEWTKIFEFKHYPCNDKQQNHSNLKYTDIVHNSSLVVGALICLTEFETYKDVAINFLKSLQCHNGNLTKACWYLEFTKQYSYPILAPSKKTFVLQSCNSTESLTSAYEVVFPFVVKDDRSTTYWNDLFYKLGL